MRRRSAAPVTASRGASQLLSAIGFMGDLQQALDLGAIERWKLVGRWLYFEPTADMERTIESVAAAAEEQLRAWLLTPTQYLRSPVARALDDRVTVDAVEAILPELIRTGRFGAVGLLTLRYQPYLAIYSGADEDEVARQIGAMRELLQRDGSVSQAALPEPARQRDAAGWKSSILKHGEFLGLGFIEDATLISWER
jgi:hypothetical protein